MLEAGVPLPTHSSYHCPVWPMKKVDGSWRLTIDYQGLNKVILTTAPAVPNKVSNIQKIQQAKGG